MGRFGAAKISMRTSAIQDISASGAFAAARALVDSLRAGGDLATVPVIISISLVVTKDTT